MGLRRSWPTDNWRAVCVYCGSNLGRNEVYQDFACLLGAELGRRQLPLVYGGASVGLMGTLADATLAYGGRVVGIIPQDLADREVAHKGLTELIVTPSMHTRKTLMAERADGFIAMPGGIGTFEELFEIWTWAQLGLHAKPVGLLNVAGYFDPLISMVDRAVEQGFLKPEQRALLHVASMPATLLDDMATAPESAPIAPISLGQT